MQHLIHHTVDNECDDALCDALIGLCIELRPLDGPVVIHTNPTPASIGLVHNELLQHHRMSFEIVCSKNLKKNPIALEKAVCEFEDVLIHIHQHPMGGLFTLP